jgi:hypothetical protein
MRAAIVWMKLTGSYTTVEVTATQYQAYRARLRERGGAAWMSGDNRIAALVEVGAIPYRERYQVRYDIDAADKPDHVKVSAECCDKFPKALGYLARSAD